MKKWILLFICAWNAMSVFGQNVGIGTTDPAALLDVAGDILINGMRAGKGPGNNAQSTAFGVSCLNSNTTGNHNCATGFGALVHNTTGSYNVSNGAYALLNNTTGALNIGVGSSALLENISGNFNTGVGQEVLDANTTGGFNTGFGAYAGGMNTTGSKNTFIGAYSNSAAPNLTNATAIGDHAFVGASNSLVLGSINNVNGATANTNVGIGTTTPSARLDVAADIRVNGIRAGKGGGDIAVNTVFGGSSLELNTTGFRNSATGFGVLHFNTSGNYNVGNGTFSLGSNTTGSSNTAVGDDAVNGNTIGNDNTGVGRNALYDNTTGVSNTGMGAFAGNANITGSHNTIIGARANLAATNLTNATAIGAKALVGSSNSLVLGSINGVNGATTNTNVGIGTTTPGARLDVADDILINGLRAGRGSGNWVANSIFGNESFTLNTIGQRNSAFGYGTLRSNSTGNYNVAVGSFALYNNSAGDGNSAIGDDAMNHNTSGVLNTAVGFAALYNGTTGNQNTSLGYQAGYYNIDGSNNTFIGVGANPIPTNLNNATAIGFQASVGASNSLVLGSIEGVNGASVNTKVGIGTTTPSASLDIVGTLKASNWHTASMDTIGYAEMGGVLLQWGKVEYMSNSTVSVAFPTSFNNVFSVTATVDAGNNSGNGANVPVKVLNVGPTSFQIAGTAEFSGDDVSKIRWMAVGN